MLNLSTQWDFRWVNIIEPSIVSGNIFPDCISVCVRVYVKHIAHSFSQFETTRTYICIIIQLWAEKGKKIGRLQNRMSTPQLHTVFHPENSLVCDKLMLDFLYQFQAHRRNLKLKQWIWVYVFCCAYEVCEWVLFANPHCSTMKFKKCICSQKVFLHKLIVVYRICEFMSLWMFVIVCHCLCVCVARFVLCGDVLLFLFLFYLNFFFVFLMVFIVTVWELSSSKRETETESVWQIYHTLVCSCQASMKTHINKQISMRLTKLSKSRLNVNE